MKKHKSFNTGDRLFVCDVPATVRYKVFAKDEIEAKVKLMEDAGYEQELKGEIIYNEEDLEQAIVEVA